MKKNYPYGNGKVKWVSTEWLETHLTDTDLFIIDTQPNIHDYIHEHIPSAVYMNEGLIRLSREGRPGQFVPAESMQAVLRNIGLGKGKKAVVYTGIGAVKGWGDGLEQTMVAYTLARYGHDQIYVLDGGIDRWKEENLPITKKFPSVATSNFTTKVHEEYFITYKEFKLIKDNSDVILLDARPKVVYEGQGPWIKPGHIPGAINVPWKNLMEDNTRLLKSGHEIEKVIDEYSITQDKTIICSCGTGREATNEFLLFKWYLEFPNVKIYEGSFTEWSSYPENPTVTGKNPR